jgi:amidophosphoribosyltransferase
VRGTTSREIVSMAKEAGAKKVFFSSCAPPITNAHIYGIDLASPNELVAHQRDSDDIAKHIGADDVIYQSLEDLESACAQASPRDPKTQKFEVGVFCGKYITPVSDEYFEHLERLRGETRRLKTLDNAREAVRQGTAIPQQVKMAVNGVAVNNNGDVVARDSGSDGEDRLPKRQKVDQLADLNGSNEQQSDRREEHRDSQDIALHNFNDYR